MTLEELREVLGWCLLMNLGLLAWWAAWIVGARDFVREMHRRWFDIPDQQFEVIHYTLMGVYKLGIILFVLIPWIVLHIIR